MTALVRPFLHSNSKIELIAFLRRSNNYSAMPDERLLTIEDQEIAEGLLALDLPSNDHAPEASYSYPEYGFAPEVEERNSLISACGFDPATVEITKHNVVLNRHTRPLNIKIIGLDHSDGSPVHNGILFLGKVTHDDGEDTYVRLTAEEMKLIKNRLSK